MVMKNLYRIRNHHRLPSLTNLLQLIILSLAVIWVSVTWMVFHGSTEDYLPSARQPKHLEKKEQENETRDSDVQPTHIEHSGKEIKNPTISLLSRNPLVKVTSNVRGNLGPASVITQDPPGKDWIKDRWQAAGDMHGTALPGQHWVMLDFGEGAPIHVTKILIDWEAAFAKNYRIEGMTMKGENNQSGSDDSWCQLYDGNNKSHDLRRTVKEHGQSPGVKFKTPLHIVHTIHLEDAPMDCPHLRYLRVFINKPARGWGVSIWELDVYGWSL